MIAALLSFLTSRLVGPLATLAALVFAGLFAWQSGRIDGWPLIGGGLKAEVADLTRQRTARDLSDARAQAMELAARQKMLAAADVQAGLYAHAQLAAQHQIRTIIQKVPLYVSAKSDFACSIPWGAVRLLDAAASGADADSVAALIAPGQPDDAASDVKLSEAVALLAANLGLARENAGQLMYLQNAMMQK